MDARFDPHHLPEQLNLADVFIDRQLPSFGDSSALYTDSATVTYRQLADQAARAATVFRGLGLELEQRVLLMLPDIPGFAYAWFGVSKAGGVVAAVNPEQKPEEVAYYLNYTRAKLLGGHAPAIPPVGAALPRCAVVKHVLLAGGAAGAPRSVARRAAR